MLLMTLWMPANTRAFTACMSQPSTISTQATQATQQTSTATSDGWKDHPFLQAIRADRAPGASNALEQGLYARRAALYNAFMTVPRRVMRVGGRRSTRMQLLRLCNSGLMRAYVCLTDGKAHKMVGTEFNGFDKENIQHVTKSRVCVAVPLWMSPRA